MQLDTTWASRSLSIWYSTSTKFISGKKQEEEKENIRSAAMNWSAVQCLPVLLGVTVAILTNITQSAATTIDWDTVESNFPPPIASIYCMC